ncbi:MAG: M12 family metallo-peptidase, partial [Bacteroidota bacterium]
MRVLVLLLALLAPSLGLAQEALFVPAGAEASRMTQQQASFHAALRSAPTTAALDLVRVRTDQFTRQPAIVLNLGAQALTLDRGRLEARGNEDYSWFSTMEDLRTHAIFVVRGGQVTGTIQRDGVVWQLRPLTGGLHALVEMDETALPPDHPPEHDAMERRAGKPNDGRPDGGHEHGQHGHEHHDHRAPGTGAAGHDEATRFAPTSGVPVAAQSTGPTIGVIVAYTPQAASEVADVPALAQLAIDETNQSYINGGVAPRVSLVHVYETSTNGTSDMVLDRNRFRNQGDGFFDEIHALRDQYGGDVAKLIGASSATYGFCGVAYTIRAYSADDAFAVTAQNCATGFYSFGHEIGHLQGARHNPEADSNTLPFAYGHGFTDIVNDFRTVMAYNSSSCPGGVCTRVPWWSNPDATYNSNPTGDASERDNARVLDETAADLAAFKNSGPPPVVGVSPSSITASAAPGATVDATVTVSNTGQSDLIWSLAVDQQVVPPNASAPSSDRARLGRPVTDAPVFDTGGPDGFGYAWRDSSEPGGPTYAWEDISSTGTSISLGDDATAEVALPFTFSFYGTNYTSVFINSNGNLTFGSGSTAYTNAGIPNAAAPNALLAAFWDDLNPSGGGSVYYGTDSQGRFAVQWDAVPPYSGGGTYTFQAILASDGRILYQYEALTGTTSSATIGIENGTGSDGLQVVSNAAYAQNGLAVEFIETVNWLSGTPGSGVINPGNDETITVTLDATELAAGTYTGSLQINSNDGATPTVTVPVTFDVVASSYPQAVLDLRGSTLADNGIADLDRFGTWPDLSPNTLDATATKPKRWPLLRDPVAPLADQPAVFFNTKTFLTLPASDSLI